jgi:hypothetical protein
MTLGKYFIVYSENRIESRNRLGGRHAELQTLRKWYASLPLPCKLLSCERNCNLVTLFWSRENLSYWNYIRVQISVHYFCNWHGFGHMNHSAREWISKTNLQTTGKNSWTGNRPMSRPLHTYRITAVERCGHTPIFRMEFKPEALVFW